jgi:hypothetical protein
VDSVNGFGGCRSPIQSLRRWLGLVLPKVGNFFEALLVSITGALVTLLSFIPNLIGALLILIIGWIVSGFVARLVVSLLERVGFERAAQSTGVTGFMTQAGYRDAKAAVVIGELVKWLIRLVVLEMAANALKLTALTELLNRVILWIPNLIVALVILMLGMLAARFVAGLVRGAVSEAGFSNPGLLASVAQYAIIAFAVVAAVNQVGIASTLVTTLFEGVVGAIALAIAIAFGLGGRDVASRMWQQWYQQGQQAAPRLQQAAEERSSQPATSTQRPIDSRGMGTSERLGPETRVRSGTDR